MILTGDALRRLSTLPGLTGEQEQLLRNRAALMDEQSNRYSWLTWLDDLYPEYLLPWFTRSTPGPDPSLWIGRHWPVTWAMCRVPTRPASRRTGAPESRTYLVNAQGEALVIDGDGAALIVSLVIAARGNGPWVPPHRIMPTRNRDTGADGLVTSYTHPDADLRKEMRR